MEPVPDLSTLNPAEREALTLLAQGHTAKSIASITGRSTGSINERLREARRKTGVGSSRELARLWAQENRDTQIGVAPAPPGDAPLAAEARVDQGRGGFAKGHILMSVVGIAAVAAVIALTAPHLDRQESSANDPLLKELVADRPDSSEYHRMLRTEARDDAWASAAEAALRQRYQAVKGVGRAANPLRVLCGNTLCEVAGALLPPGMSRTTVAVQRASLKPVSIVGGDLRFASFSIGGGKPQSPVFVAYWTRAARP